MKPESRRFFFIVALCCCIASVCVSFFSLFGIDIARYFPPVWILHLGIFLVWIPSIAVFMKYKNRFQPQIPFGGGNRITVVYSLLIGNPPKLYKRIAAVVAIYAVAVIVLVANKVPNGSLISNNGVYTLYDHGKISLLTEEQFLSYSAARTGLFAAFWILFYTLGPCSGLQRTTRNFHWRNYHEIIEKY